MVIVPVTKPSTSTQLFPGISSLPVEGAIPDMNEMALNAHSYHLLSKFYVCSANSLIHALSLRNEYMSLIFSKGKFKN